MRLSLRALVADLALAFVTMAGALPASAASEGGRLSALRGRQVPLLLAAGPFPDSGHANVLAYVPRRFSGVEPIPLVVYIHGWRGCAQVIMNDEEAPCERGGDSTHAYHLADALEASGKDAVLLVIQGPYDARSNDDGTLADPGGFDRILQAALTGLAQAAGEASGRPPPVLGSIQLVAHSGAVKAVADVLRRGGLDDSLLEVDLLDVLYGEAETYAWWLDRTAEKAVADPSERRLVLIYTCCAGTAPESRALARRPLPAESPTAGPLRVVDHVAGPLPPRDLAAPIAIVETDVDHDALPLVYFPQLLATSALRSLPAVTPTSSATR